MEIRNEKILNFGLKIFFLSLSFFQLSLAEIFLYQNNSDNNHSDIYHNIINIAQADTSDSWYNSNWLYRKEISISGSTSDLTDYQIKQNIGYESGKMNSDFSDLRFVSSDGITLYDYYIEAKTDSVSAVIWIKVPSIPTTGTYFFMYYGNSAASSLSNKDATLEKWTQTSDADFRLGNFTDSLARNNELNLDVDVDWTSQNGMVPNIDLYITPDFADLDNDGDADVLIGNNYGFSVAYKNIGAINNPIWTREENWDVPDVGSLAVPVFVDLDQDNDLDLIIGSENGISYAYKNTGTVSSPVWMQEASWNIPDIGSNSYPAFADLDGDGDYDALIGNYVGTVLAYKNTGTINSPVWIRETGWDMPDVGAYTNAVLKDIDGDLDFDLFVLEIAYRNTGTVNSPIWTRDAALDIPDVGYGNDPSFFDLDADGDLDVIIGERYGGTYSYRNAGTVSVPVWSRQAEWDILMTNYNLDPAFADLDNDGDNDLIMGDRDGFCLGYRNIGSSSIPSWERFSLWDVADIGTNTSPDLIDIDNDGDYDMFIGEDSGVIYGYENIGSVSVPSWQAKASWNTPDTGRSPIPAFADLDGDGDYDFISGDYSGFSYAYENTGGITSPIWTRKSAWDLPDDMGIDAGVAFSDIDDDGDLDVVASDSYGKKFFYRNIGTISVPAWERREIWDAVTSLYNASSDFIDLNGDGDEELFFGFQYGDRILYQGNFYYFISASFTSSSFNSTSFIKPQSLSFNSTIPTNTSLKFQLAANNDNSTWNFTGPDGTDSTYYQTNNELTNINLNNNQYLKYKAYLETTDTAITPVLSDITIYYAQSATIEPTVTLADFSQSMDHFNLSSSINAIKTKETLTLTIQAIDSQNNIFTNYAGDKTITLTGANPDGIDNPTFTDKNGNKINFNSSGIITFTNGIATTDITLYKAETATIIVNDESYSSIPLNIEVKSSGSSFIPPTKPNLSSLTIISQNNTLTFTNLPNNITQIALSNSEDFSNSSFQDITLPIPTTSTLYLKFRTHQGATSDTIIYSPASTDAIIQEGDIVKTDSSFDVYIIKLKNNKQYKRLILSPSVFNSYQHLKWENIKTISQEQINQYQTSDLVKVQNDNNIYKLTSNGDQGTKKIVAAYNNGIITLIQDGTTIDIDSIYEINKVDRESYATK